MPSIFIPKPETFQKIQDLMYGFWLDIDEEDNCVLILKLEASLIDSIIGGKPIKLVLRNPNISKRSCTLYIYDIKETPFFYSGQNFSSEDNVLKGFDEVAIKFVKSKSIKIALFNELSHCVFTTILKAEDNNKNFNIWLYKVYNSTDFRSYIKNDIGGNYFPENELKGFEIKIKNIDNSKEKKLTVIAPEFGELKDGRNYVAFNHEEYQGDGKHGYYQELSILNNLNRFFKPEVEYFANPFSQDGTEFIDFVIIYKEAVVLIESKYVISDKSTKRNAALLKAVSQLNKAECLIYEKKVDLRNKELSKVLNDTKNILKICLLNNKTVLTDENTKNIASICSKELLPLFTSTTIFFQFLTSLLLKNPALFMKNMFFNIKRIHIKYLNSNDAVLYFENYSVEGLSPEELNRIGAENFSEKKNYP